MTEILTKGTFLHNTYSYENRTYIHPYIYTHTHVYTTLKNSKRALEIKMVCSFPKVPVLVLLTSGIFHFQMEVQ